MRPGRGQRRGSAGQFGRSEAAGIRELRGDDRRILGVLRRSGPFNRSPLEARPDLCLRNRRGNGRGRIQRRGEQLRHIGTNPGTVVRRTRRDRSRFHLRGRVLVLQLLQSCNAAGRAQSRVRKAGAGSRSCSAGRFRPSAGAPPVQARTDGKLTLRTRDCGWKGLGAGGGGATGSDPYVSAVSAVPPGTESIRSRCSATRRYRLRAGTLGRP